MLIYNIVSQDGVLGEYLLLCMGFGSFVLLAGITG